MRSYPGNRSYTLAISCRQGASNRQRIMQQGVAISSTASRAGSKDEKHPRGMLSSKANTMYIQVIQIDHSLLTCVYEHASKIDRLSRRNHTSSNHKQICGSTAPQGGPPSSYSQSSWHFIITHAPSSSAIGPRTLPNQAQNCNRSWSCTPTARRRLQNACYPRRCRPDSSQHCHANRPGPHCPPWPPFLPWPMRGRR